MRAGRSLSVRGWHRLILVLYAVFGLGYSLLWPTWEEIDERVHYQRSFFYAYGVSAPAENWETFQPQLYYRLSSWPLMLLNGIDPSFINADQPPTRHFGNVPRVLWNKENYQFLLGPHLLRWLNLILGGLAIHLVYKGVLRFVPESPALAPATMALAGLTPNFLHFNAMVSNDALANLAGAFLFWLLSRVRSERASWREAVLMAGAGFLLPLIIKLTVLPIGVAVVLAAGWRLRSYWRTHWHLLLGSGTLLVAGLILGLVVFFPETASNLWLNLSVRSSHVRPAPFHRLGRTVLFFSWSYWGTISHGAPALSSWLTVMLSGLLSAGWLASLQLLRGNERRADALQLGRRTVWIIVWLAAGLALLVVARNGLATGRYQGRYLFPSIGALSLLALAGWRVLLPSLTTRYLLHATVLGMIGLNLWVWFVELIPVYYQPFLD